MSSRRVVVVDGSNIATEGRSQPSLSQLDEAVRAYREENPDDEIIVVVDATFAHRIDDSERALFEDAAAHNELVYPPAGAVGRGDAFLLRIAEKTDAVVLSNDSFQEFHGEHDWLFEKGRLIGGTPVPGVGWIFVARTPVRGPKSREAVKEAKRTKARIGSKAASQPMPLPKTPPPRAKKKGKKAEVVDDVEVDEAIAVATEEAVGEDAGNGAAGGKGRKRRRKRRTAAVAEPPALNAPLTFIEFIAEHKLGSTVEGVVESFASHGAFVSVGDATCYIPLSAMGEPPPRSAREVLRKGEARPFVVQALDAARRGIELALPGFEHVAGAPTEETVEAEIAEAPALRPDAAAARRAPTRKATAAAGAKRAPGRKAATAATAGAKKAAAKAKKETPARKAARKAAAAEPARRDGPPPEKAAAKKAATKKAAPKKAAAKAVATKSATKSVAKKAATTKAGAKKVATKAAPSKAAKTTKSTKVAKATKAAPTKATKATKATPKASPKASPKVAKATKAAKAAKKAR